MQSGSGWGAERKLLIAEDDLASRTVLEGVTRKWGYEPVVVNDGVRAWERMQVDEPPRRLLLGWLIPKIDGVELCRRLRARQPFEVEKGPAHRCLIGRRRLSHPPGFGMRTQ